MNRQLTSTQALGAGFAAILGLLAYSTFEAAALQRAGGEHQAQAHARFVLQDDAITAVRRDVWLGGIYARDYFLNRGPAGRKRFAAQLEELEKSGASNLAILRRTSPARLKELEIESGFDEYLRELRTIDSREKGAASVPVAFIDDVVIPRRLALLALFEDFRSTVRRELVDAEIRYGAERAASARTLIILLAAALLLGLLVALASIRYVARLERERHQHDEANSIARQELEDLSNRLLEIQEEERSALSRELHDEVGQTLTALRMEISQSMRRVSDPEALERLGRARGLADRSVQVVRDISLMLRPSLLDDLGLGPALQWQLERFSSRSGIACRFEGSDVGEDLPEPVKTCVFRIAQEALNNCEKYADASNVRVVLKHEDGLVSLEICDDGRGFAVDHRGMPARGTGILGMKERALKLGGTLAVDSVPGAGTRVYLNLSVAEPVSAP